VSIIVEGKTYSKAADTPENTLFTLDRKGLVGYASHVSFLRARRDAREREVAKTCLDQLSRARKTYRETPSGKEQRQVRTDQVAIVDMARTRLELELRRRGVKLTDAQAVQRLATEVHPFRGPAIHSAILYQFTGYTGRVLLLPGGAWYPDLGWFDFDNRPSAVILSGYLTLCQYTWFSGRVLFLIAFPIGGYDDLDGHGWDFDNRTSSAIAG
jgi:hypothetical protein